MDRILDASDRLKLSHISKDRAKSPDYVILNRASFVRRIADTTNDNKCCAKKRSWSIQNRNHEGTKINDPHMYPMHVKNNFSTAEMSVYDFDMLA
jgi:hypothetical protein